MNLEQIKLLKMIFVIMSSVLLMVIVLKIKWKESVKRTGDAGIDFAGRILKRTKLNYFKFDAVQKFLSTKGAVYLFGDMATPVNFIILKVLLMLLMFFVGLSGDGFLLGIILASIGFFFPDMLLSVSNNVDNDVMLTDIRCIYDTLRIQTKAGVFLSVSLSECYLAVRNGRLKNALLELTNDINTRSDIEDALERFNVKFDSGQIDIFCIVIRQALESGKSVKVLEDLSLQMNDLQHVIHLKEKEKLDRKIQIMELLIFIGLLAVTVYILGVEVMSSIQIY